MNNIYLQRLMLRQAQHERVYIAVIEFLFPRLYPSPQHLRYSPCLRDAAARSKRRIAVEDFAYAFDAQLLFP